MANKTGKSVRMWDERERRIKRVMKWINAIPSIEWSRATRAALIPRIRSEWPGIDRDAKAEALLADAERVLAGSASLESLRGGRPREFIRKVSVSDLRALYEAYDRINRYALTSPEAAQMQPLFDAVINLKKKY